MLFGGQTGLSTATNATSRRTTRYLRIRVGPRPSHGDIAADHGVCHWLGSRVGLLQSRYGDFPTLWPLTPMVAIAIDPPCDARHSREILNAPPPCGPDSDTVDALDIVELRALLQLALSRLGDPVTEAELKPQAIEDLDQLETRLAGALQEVRDLKKSFGVT